MLLTLTGELDDNNNNNKTLIITGLEIKKNVWSQICD